jgi:hypothetical protein
MRSRFVKDRMFRNGGRAATKILWHCDDGVAVGMRKFVSEKGESVAEASAKRSEVRYLPFVG